MSTYQSVKDQISFAVTGKQAIICPHCGKPASAYTSRKMQVAHRTIRRVRTACRHCRTIISFDWS